MHIEILVYIFKTDVIINSQFIHYNKNMIFKLKNKWYNKSQLLSFFLN